METSSAYVPSCESGGAFTSRQCQQGGQCWCVDPTGAELPGTRRLGDSVVCGEYLIIHIIVYFNLFTFNAVKSVNHQQIPNGIFLLFYSNLVFGFYFNIL